MKNYTYRKLEWDSQYFGCVSSRVDLIGTLTSTDILEIKHKIQKDVFITLTNAKGLVENNKIITQELGCYLVDTNIHLINEKLENDIKQKFACVLITDGSDDKNQIMNIAQTSFLQTRFYNDAHISNEKASNLYKNWIINALQNKKKYFCIFKCQDIVKGFLLFSKEEFNRVNIELIAVDKEYRDEGIGSKMMMGLIQECIDYDAISVGTQVENINAINFYTKNGFRISDVKYTYHLWNV